MNRKAEIKQSIRNEQEMLKKYRGYVKRLEAGKKVGYLSLTNARHTVSAMKQTILNKKKLLKKMK